jgi:hypothetical protein
LEALKMKVMVPSVKQALKAKATTKQYLEDRVAKVDDTQKATEQAKQPPPAQEVKKTQAQGDRAGIKVRLI